MNEWNNASAQERPAEQAAAERAVEPMEAERLPERDATEHLEKAAKSEDAHKLQEDVAKDAVNGTDAAQEEDKEELHLEEAAGKGESDVTEETEDLDAGEDAWDRENEAAYPAGTTATEEHAGSAAEYAAAHKEKADAVDSASLASIEPLLDDRIVRAVREMGFEKLTPIQVQAIPYLLDGEDIIGQAQTGTGKTAAFAIPALQKIDPDLRKLQTVILCPTRELAMQAAEEIRHIAKYMHGIKVLPVYGGQDISKQIRGLKDVQIVVGTPGRVMDHMRRHTIKLDYVNMVVLDEADEMLDMGFREDMELILGEIPNAHQTALFSATMPQPILEIANQFQKDARLVRVAAKELTIPLVSQRYYRVKSQDKDAACVRLLEYYQPKLCLIFCNTKIKVDEVSEMLKKADFRAEGLHGDMSQHQRDVAMNHFRNGSTNILIATDVAARGIDVDNVEVVINYDLPQDNEYYVHRIGRTGRAGKTGRSFTFVSGRELFRVKQIERFCHTTIEERELPAASKVMKAKAEKYLNQSWELHGREDMDLMKNYVERKMEEEGCDALDLAAVMLKFHIGDVGPEIEADDYEARGGRGDRGRSRGGRGRRGRGDERRMGERGEAREGRRRRDRDEERGERRGRGRDEERRERRGRERDEEREIRRSREVGDERESYRRNDQNEARGNREERRNSDWATESRVREEHEIRKGRDWEESRESRRRRDRDEGSDSRRRLGRAEVRDDRVRRGREEDRDSRRKRERSEERPVHGRFERESSRDRDSRRKHDREESRPSRLRDVRMDGSDRGLAFSFPKKKRK